jgi:hypothetical protein
MYPVGTFKSVIGDVSFYKELEKYFVFFDSVWKNYNNFFKSEVIICESVNLI